MKKAARNFRNPYDVEAKAPMTSRPPVRVVLNVGYLDSIDVGTEQFSSKLMEEMKQSNVSEVIVMDADGAIARYKKSA